MNDVVDARESFGDLRAKKTMRIRNNADPHSRGDPWLLIPLWLDDGGPLQLLRG
jgi:hypothetical protein